jgi:hypothetical protein
LFALTRKEDAIELCSWRVSKSNPLSCKRDTAIHKNPCPGHIRGVIRPTVQNT